MTQKQDSKPGALTSDDPSDQASEGSPQDDDKGQLLPDVSLSDLSEGMQAAVREAGWDALMPVQSKAIPYLLEGLDLMVQSRTGSGKTGAFLLPIIAKIDTRLEAVQALVLVPTRELARQVAEEAERLTSQGAVRTVVVYGGVGYGPQISALKGGSQLVVGTPGRILDHLMRGTMSLKRLKTLVFDEADRLMSMGFYPDMRRLAEFMPGDRCSYMFSATYPPSVLGLADRFLKDPARLNLSGDTVHVVDTEHVYYVTSSMDKDRGLIRLIEIENPESAIVFCNRKSSVEYLAQVLKRFGYNADQMTSDLNQKQRERVLKRLRDKQLRFLVATDLAARGIDIDRLSHVILYDCPEEPESYIHRAGRTGRAGAVGTALSLVGHAEEIQLKKVAKQFSIPMECRPIPTDEDVQKVVAERVTAMLESDLRSRDSLQVERMQRLIPLARSLGESEDERAVIAMLIDDYYQKSLHAGPDWDEPQPQERPQHPAPKKKRGGRRRRRRRPRRKPSQ